MGFYTKDNQVERDVNKEHSYEEVWKELILDRVYTAKDKVVIVDADALVYRISAMCDTRSILVSRGSKTKEFDTRTKFKEYCKSKDLDYETFTIEDKIVSEGLSHCLATIKRAIKNIKEGFNATEIVFFLGGSYNARTDLPLPSQYKSNRSEQIRPKHLKGAREYLAKWYNTYVVTDIEADDIVLTKWRYSAFKKSDFEQRIKESGRDQLIICGVYAHIGCLLTAAEAFMLDMQAFLVGDALADFSLDEHRMALNYAAGRCAKVVDADSVIQAVNPRAKR